MKATIRDNFRGGYLSLNKQFIGLLPIKIPQNPDEKKISEKIARRASQTLGIRSKLSDIHLSDRERDQLEREIEAYETQIDALVCELYGVKEVPE
jgi:hypothetical protein